MKKSLFMVCLAVLAIVASIYWANVNVSGGCCDKHAQKGLDSGFKCTFCKGTGWNGEFNCSFCKGTGRNSSY